MFPDSVMYTLVDILDKSIWGVIIGIRAGRFSIGPCRGSLKFNKSSTDPLESGLFTLKSSRAEPDQLSIVYGKQGITVENRSGPRRSGSKNK
ncbi:unnamed protein product [Trifolium pratense]|uniref:Uncharacterized protein n=1 Tax=Trifolium pratense TaxID=57577 RepID=A0ACB0LU19_TRIPR|nr:unnamed protein product [Trifolium pratense]